MIIIDEQTELSLIRMLEALRSKPESMRCIHWRLSHHPRLASAARQRIKTVAPDYLSQENLQIYLCEDEDIFVLASVLALKDARPFMADVATHIGVEPTPELAELIELNPHINKLLSEVQAKYDRKQAAQAAAKKQKEQEVLARKRAAILSLPDLGNAVELMPQKRAGRTLGEIMVIEDDSFSRKLVENVLSKHYHVTGLGDADSALITYVRTAPDVVFLDINLPNVTGHELLEKFTAIDPHAYVIMLSGNADRENIMQAMQRGAKGFVAKPFTRDKLLQYIERCPTLHS